MFLARNLTGRRRRRRRRRRRHLRVKRLTFCLHDKSVRSKFAKETGKDRGC